MNSKTSPGFQTRRVSSIPSGTMSVTCLACAQLGVLPGHLGVEETGASRGPAYATLAAPSDTRWSRSEAFPGTDVLLMCPIGAEEMGEVECNFQSSSMRKKGEHVS